MSKLIELRDLGDDFFRNIRPVVLLGFFDGVHRGHQRIIEEGIRVKSKNNTKSVVFTFFNHPSEIFSGKETKKLLLPFEEKIDIIYGLGIDYIIATGFNKAFSELSPLQFCDDILQGKFHAGNIIVGQNYRFGKDGKGDIDYLKGFFSDKNTAVKEISLLKIKETIISSTKIRELILKGYVTEAASLLGRPPYVTGKVKKEKGLGRTLGFPTINIKPPENIIIPKDGVYAGIVETGRSTRLASAINVGKSPTLRQKERSIEAHILDFEGDLYGRDVKILFYRKIREEKKFKSLDGLKKQVKKDISDIREIVREIYATNL